MKKFLYLFILFFLFIDSVFPMEEREKIEKIRPKIKAELNKLPKNVNQEIQEILTLEKIPSDLLLPILIQLAAGPTLADSLKAMKNFRLISNRFNALIEDEKFVTNMVNYWSKKYAVPCTYIPVTWSITLSDLPDELIMSILSRLASGKNIIEEIKILNKLRLVSKRFNDLVNDQFFVKNLIDFWAKKYNAPTTYIAILWNSPGARKWLELEDIEILEESPKKIIRITDDYNYWMQRLTNPIFYAITLDRKEIIKILVNKGVEINNTLSKIFRNPFMKAIANSDKLGLDFIKFLIEKGANVNYVAYEDTPLLTAIKFFKQDVVDLLLKNGANPTLMVEGETPMGLAQRYKRSREYLLKIHMSPELIEQYKKDLKGLEKIIELLKKYGA